MIFDGSNIIVGDQVYDVVFGVGIVQHVLDAEDRFTVNYGNRMYSYNSKGVGNFPQKTVYWQDPVQGYLPMKHDSNWALFCKLRNAISSIVWNIPEII